MSFESKLRRVAALAIVVLAAVVVVGTVLAGSQGRMKEQAPEAPDAAEAPEPPEPREAPNVFWVGGDSGPYLGVHIEEDVDSPEGGARITDVVDESPARRAGLEEGDVIVAFDGSTIRGPVGLTKQIRSREAGDRVTIVVVRDGKRRSVEVELGDRAGSRKAWQIAPEHFVPLEQLEQLGRMHESLKGLEKIELPDFKGQLQLYGFASRARLGVQLVEATSELRQHFGGDREAGVLVSKVVKGMPAEHAGIQVGDLIVAIEGDPIESVEDLREALSDRSGDTFEIEVIRNRDRLRLKATLPADDEDDSAGPRALLLPPLPPPRNGDSHRNSELR